MSSYNNPIQQFLQSVCGEIRYRSIHTSICKELSDHIEDQKHEYINQGLDDEAATAKAIEQMGDPVVIGRQLNKAHKPRTEWSILSIVAGLVIIGAYLQYFLSGVIPNGYTFSRFILYAPIGITAFAFMYFFDYGLLSRYSRLVYSAILAVTAAGFFFSVRINGSYLHMYYSALLLIPGFAGVLYSFKGKGYRGILLCEAFYAAAALMCLWASSYTILIFFTVSCLIILTTAVVKGFFNCRIRTAIAMIYSQVLLVSILFIQALPSYALRRFSSMLNPEQDPLGSGYLILTIRKLIASAKPFGTAVLSGGLNGTDIHQLLPEWSTDFLLTYVIARLGYIPAIAIIALMLLLIVRMFSSVAKQRNEYGFLIAFSACIAITGQIVFHVLSNIGIIMPLSFVLPFISYGGSGFILNMILTGLLLSVYRRIDLTTKAPQGSIK